MRVSGWIYMDPSFDLIWCMKFTYMPRKLVVHITIHIINTSILVCDYCILLSQALVMVVIIHKAN